MIVYSSKFQYTPLFTSKPIHMYAKRVLNGTFSNFWASNVLFRKLQKFESALKNRVIESRYKMISRITSTLSGSNINQWFNIFSKCCHFNWKMKIFRTKKVELLTKNILILALFVAFSRQITTYATSTHNLGHLYPGKLCDMSTPLHDFLDSTNWLCVDYKYWPIFDQVFSHNVN